MPPFPERPCASGTNTGRRSRVGSRRGMALVVTLAILVLMLGMAMAFFSKVTLDRSIRSASATRDQTSTLARSAIGIITSDLLQEIAAGSESDSLPGLQTPYFQPRTTNSTTTLLGSTIPLALTPSMAPQNTVNSTTHPTLIKLSRSDLASFSMRPGYETRAGVGNATLRASAVSTTNGFGSTRGIPASYWEEIRLGSSSNATSLLPDWIYLDRSANTPILGNATLGTASNRTLTNTGHVIGRFAYRIYDVGGLLDLNLLGNHTATGGNATRSSLADLPLSLPGLGNATLSSFADWRNGGNGTRSFLSRIDLLRTSAARGDLSSNATQWFTLGNVFSNAPAYLPNPYLIAATPSNLDPGLLNPILPRVRFSANTTLSRGTDQDVTVPSGSPVMPRKFPLSKLNLLSDPSANAQDLTYYFGLQRQGDGSYRYTAADASGNIKDLATVATEGREPNFFEVLQAVIATGSLGRNAGNTYSVDQQRDESRSRQIFQVGANIVDQWDANDFPTTIKYAAAGVTLENELNSTVYGVENLPYINSVAIMGHRPSWDRNRFQLWAVFDVWNPHQNASTLPSGIDSFRIEPMSGNLSVTLNLLYGGNVFNNDGILRNLASYVADTERNSGFQSVPPLNSTRQLVFASNGNYTAPTLVGESGPPSSPDWAGGLLLNDFQNIPPAVPSNIQGQQAAYSTLINGGDNKPGLNDLLRAANQPLIGPPGGTFGPKAHNWFRFRSTPLDKVIVDLQYRRTSDGQWVTFQRLERFLPISSDPISIDGEPVSLRGGSSGSTTVTDTQLEAANVLVDTLSDTPSNANRSFYGWRFDEQIAGPAPEDNQRMGMTLVKFDPRTIRFGHNDLRRTQRGRTIRQSISTPVFPTSDARRDVLSGWMMLRFNIPKTGEVEAYIAGIGQSYYPLQPPNAMQYVFGTGAAGDPDFLVPFGYIGNIPEAPLSAATNPTRYLDRDGIIRPGDGYLGAVPTAIPISAGTGRGSLADRPLLLNRPFRSVGEMGHAFRDLPWKSLDFFTRNSGDLGLLDAFSLDEEAGLVEGKVNLNSAPEPVLAALLAGTGRTASGGNPISQGNATQIAQQIVLERQTNGPFSTVGDLVARVFSPSSHNVNTPTYTPSEHRKSEREAAIRTLSALGETRTWNLLIDLVVQSGRFAPGATDPAHFQAKGQSRYWVHLVIDRLTGQTLQQRWEAVNE